MKENFGHEKEGSIGQEKMGTHIPNATHSAQVEHHVRTCLCGLVLLRGGFLGCKATDRFGEAWRVTTSLTSSSRTELRYDTAHALQNRVFRLLCIGGGFCFTHLGIQLRTPHSSRATMPSSTSALGSDRSFLGGLAAQATDRYARIDKLRISACNFHTVP